MNNGSYIFIEVLIINHEAALAMGFGLVSIINYVAWFIFVFIGVVWILTLLQNKNPQENKKALKKQKVSVIIPAYNEETTITKCIKSILNLDYPKKLLEIIVVNDCSRDNTEEVANGFRKFGVKVLSNKTNRGKSYSLNRGIKAATGTLVACIDADSFVDSKALKNMTGYFEDLEIAAVTPAVKVLKPKTLIERIQHVEYLLNVFLRKMLAVIDAVHVTPGVFSVYRRDVLMDVGGFSEGNLTEDMDIALKIHKAGYKIENSVNAVSYTICPSGWRELFSQRLRWYRGAFDNMYKYRGMMFKRRYGNLGIFLLPLNLISTLLIIFIFGSMVWGVIGSVNDFMWKMGLVNWDIGVYLKEFKFTSLFFIPFSTPIMFGMFGVIIGVYLLNKSFGMTREKVKGNKMSYIIYLFLYPLIMVVFWTAALFHEIFRLKKKW